MAESEILKKQSRLFTFFPAPPPPPNNEEVKIFLYARTSSLSSLFCAHLHI